MILRIDNIIAVSKTPSASQETPQGGPPGMGMY